MDGVSVIEFQVEYPDINLELMKDKKKYDMAILVGYTIELERGFIVKKINKTTRKGTKFTFKGCESEEEARVYLEKLDDLLNKYNKKYDTSYYWKGLI